MPRFCTTVGAAEGSRELSGRLLGYVELLPALNKEKKRRGK